MACYDQWSSLLTWATDNTSSAIHQVYRNPRLRGAESAPS